MKFNYKKIKPIRKSKGLTQGDIVEYLSQHFNKSYNRSTISSKECGRNPFNLQEIEALAEFMEVDLSDFFDGKAPAPKPQTQGDKFQSEVVSVNVEMQTYLLQRVKELEAENKNLKDLLENPRNGAATPAVKK